MLACVQCRSQVEVGHEPEHRTVPVWRIPRRASDWRRIEREAVLTTPPAPSPGGDHLRRVLASIAQAPITVGAVRAARRLVVLLTNRAGSVPDVSVEPTEDGGVLLLLTLHRNGRKERPLLPPDPAEREGCLMAQCEEYASVHRPQDKTPCERRAVGYVVSGPMFVCHNHARHHEANGETVAPLGRSSW